MNKINEISKRYGSLPYMRHAQALYMRDVILSQGFKSLCELGHYHGKSSVYLGAILEEQGYGKLTTYDLDKVAKQAAAPKTSGWLWQILTPSIHDLIAEFELSEYIEVVTSMEGYAWDLYERIQRGDVKYDFCYIDGGHTYQSTLVAFTLTNMMLEPGGIIIFDDIDWTIAAQQSYISGTWPYANVTKKEAAALPIKMICDTIVPRCGYTLLDWNEKLKWAVYRKNG